MEPIESAPKNGGPVWAQISFEAFVEEESCHNDIKLTEATTRETRRTWIYWAEPGLPSCNPDGHWAIVASDFRTRRFIFFIDGWFPQFTPAHTSEVPVDDVDVEGNFQRAVKRAVKSWHRL
jgi:hypothetical protein